MSRKTLLQCLTIAGLAYGVAAHAHVEVIAVHGYFFKDGIDNFRFTVNGDHYYICTGGAYCPSSMYISIKPDKDNIFDLYDYRPRGSYYTISDSCKKQVINVKPHTGRTIKIVRNNREIVCNY